MMERLKESKWVYVLLSIILAVVFWLYVRAELDPQDSDWINNIPVEITGSAVLSRQGLTVSSLSMEKIDIQVEAPSSILTDLLRNKKDIKAVLDVSKCTEGENKLIYDIKLPTNINTESIFTTGRKPDSILVTVDKLYSKTFDVELQLRGKIADGYIAGTPAINPETVIISGSVEQVSQISRVVAILEEEELKEQFAGDLPLTMLDSNGNVLTDLEVTLSSQSAYVVLPVVIVKEVPLTISLTPGGGATKEDAEYEIEPKSIFVSGAEEDLKDLTEISLGSVDLAKVVGANVIQKEIVLDPSLENISGTTTASVMVTIEGLTTRSFDVTNISFSSVPNGYRISSATQVKPVVVRGTEKALDQIDASQLRIVADLKNIAAIGTIPVPVKVYLDANSEVGVIGEYSIFVNISK